MNSEETKKIFSNKLKMYMSINNLTQKDISEITGVSQQSVSNWVNAKLMPRMGVIETLADYFKIKKSSLIENTPTEAKKEKNASRTAPTEILIPLYDKIIESYPYLPDNNIVEYLPFSGRLLSPDKNYFAIHTNAPALIGKRIGDGDVAIFKKVTEIKNGETGLFYKSDIGVFIGKYLDHGKFVLLEPISDDYDVAMCEKGSKEYTLIGVYESIIVLSGVN